MTDPEHAARLAKLKQAQRQQSAREDALRRMLEPQGGDIDDKVAAVKTAQKADNRRVLSAFNQLMKKDQ